MRSEAAPARWQRRARPLLGTLVEIGVDANAANAQAAIDAAYAAIVEIQGCLSRFDAASDIARFHALEGGESLEVRQPTREVLVAARAFGEASGGLFDITQGHGRAQGWRVEGERLHKVDADARIDLGGIGKGYAVDAAVDTLQANGCNHGWVNAGGDLRAFGAADVPIVVRDESRGGSRPFATLAGGAFATSHYAPGSRSAAWFSGRLDGTGIRAHVSVAAPRCLWADALTKVVAASADPGHPLLATHRARAWIHSRP